MTSRSSAVTLHHRYDDCFVVPGDTFDPTCGACDAGTCDGDCVESYDAGNGGPRVTCPLCREDMGLSALPDSTGRKDYEEAQEAARAVFARVFDH